MAAHQEQEGDTHPPLSAEDKRALVVAAVEGMCLAVCKRSPERTEQKSDPVFIAHCVEVWEAQKGLCAITGVEMALSPLRTSKQMSIDRIDGGIGYVPGNVRLVCSWANFARGMWSDDVFWRYVKALTNPRASERPPSIRRPIGLSYDRRSATQRRHRGPFEFLVFRCAGTHSRCAERKRQMRRQEFIKHVVCLLEVGGLRCSMSGMTMTYDTFNDDPDQMTIIRLREDEGWDVGNVTLVCTFVSNAFCHYGKAAGYEFLHEVVARAADAH